MQDRKRCTKTDKKMQKDVVYLAIDVQKWPEMYVEDRFVQRWASTATATAVVKAWCTRHVHQVGGTLAVGAQHVVGGNKRTRFSFYAWKIWKDDEEKRRCCWWRCTCLYVEKKNRKEDIKEKKMTMIWEKDDDEREKMTWKMMKKMPKDDARSLLLPPRPPSDRSMYAPPPCRLFMPCRRCSCCRSRRHAMP